MGFNGDGTQGLGVEGGGWSGVWGKVVGFENEGFI